MKMNEKLIKDGDFEIEVNCEKEITKEDIRYLKESVKQKIPILLLMEKNLWKERKKEMLKMKEEGLVDNNFICEGKEMTLEDVFKVREKEPTELHKGLILDSSTLEIDGKVLNLKVKKVK